RLARVFIREDNAGHGLIEKPRKRSPAGNGFLIQQLLLWLAQVMRQPDPFLLQVMAKLGKLRRMDEPQCRLLRQLDPLQIEEDEMFVDESALLARPAQESAALGIVGLGGMP